jgi:hypothetical protein
MILGRPFLATSSDIINMDQGENIIGSEEDYLAYKVSRKHRYRNKYAMPKEEIESLKVEDYDQVRWYEDNEPEGQGFPSTA